MDKATHLIEHETMLLGRHHISARRREGSLLDYSAYILLSRIRLVGPMSIRQLSDAFGLDASTLHRQTAAMLGDGLVERIPDPDGGIARKFRITAEGEYRLDHERQSIISGLEKILDAWTPDDVAVFAAYLQRFNTDIERLAGRSWPRPLRDRRLRSRPTWQLSITFGHGIRTGPVAEHGVPLRLRRSLKGGGAWLGGRSR